MSSTIIYHMVGMLMPTTMTGQEQDLILIAAQMGESNCFEMGLGGRNGRRSRGWDALHWGTSDEVLADIVRMAGAFEGGGLKLDRASGDVSPEFYIGRGKRILKQAQDNSLAHGPVAYRDGYVHPYLRDRGTNNSSDTVDWKDRDAVSAFITRVRSEGMTHRSWYYFHVSGPELRA